jgi:hypothetical protein
MKVLGAGILDSARLELLGLGVAPHERLKGVAEREVGREGVIDDGVDDHASTGSALRLPRRLVA